MLLCAAGLAGSFLLARNAVVVAGSEILADSDDRVRIRKAETLWPENPEAHYRAGLLLTQPLNAPDYAQGVQEMRLAVSLDPDETKYWKGLAAACELAGDLDCATTAMIRFRQLEPKNPEVLWLTGNFDIRLDRAAAGMRELADVLRMDPEYDQAVLFSLMNCIECSPRSVEDIFVEAGPKTELRYLDYLTLHGEEDAAYRLWRGLVSHAGPGSRPFSFASASPYFGHVMERGRGGEARQIVEDLERMGVVDAPTPDGNLVFNGDFENPRGAGPDWSIPEIPYASADVSPGGYHGNSYLRLEFPISRNDNFILAYQLVPVEPRTEYELTAWARSEGVASDSGPRIQIFDPKCQACLDVSTDSTTGTTPWRQVRAQFNTGPATDLVRIQIDRAKSRNYPPEIVGSAGFDDIEMHKAVSHGLPAVKTAAGLY